MEPEGCINTSHTHGTWSLSDWQSKHLCCWLKLRGLLEQQRQLLPVFSAYRIVNNFLLTFGFTSPENSSCVAVEKKLRWLENVRIITVLKSKFESPLCSLHVQAGLQITDYVHHSNETSKRESIISVGEASTSSSYTHAVEKSRLGVLLCPIKSV